MRLELAADYLVMAAWLAYLKSRLLLPETDERSGPERRGHGDRARAAAAPPRGDPQRRRSADRPAAARPRRVRRGAPEPIADIKRPEWTATLYDLLTAYAAAAPEERARARALCAAHRVVARRSARQALERLVGATQDWGRLDEFLIAYLVEPSHARDRACVELRGDAGNGARGRARGAAARARSRRSSCASAPDDEPPNAVSNWHAAPAPNESDRGVQWKWVWRNLKSLTNRPRTNWPSTSRARCRRSVRRNCG